MQIHLLHNIDQALGDSITSDDTTKDVDEDCGDLRITGDQIEGGLDRFRSSTTTDVQEVCWRTTIDLDDVHGSHRQAGAIDEAPNITIKFDEVQAVSNHESATTLPVRCDDLLGSLDLIGIFLRSIPPLKDLFLSKIRVVIKA